jgi:hypothetical protein
LSAQALGQTLYEAENATLGGTANVSTEHAGYTGAGYVQGYDAGDLGASTTFSVSVTPAGWYDVTLRYGNGYGASSISVYVNSAKAAVAQLPSTGSWTIWSTVTQTFLLTAGVNRIAYVYDTGDGARINLDNVAVSPTASSKPDLAVSSIQWVPVSPLESDSIRFSATVANRGNAASPASGFLVSFRIGGAEVAASPAYTAAIAPGEPGANFQGRSINI